MIINANRPNLYQSNSTNFQGLLKTKYHRTLSKSAMASMMNSSEENIEKLTRFTSSKRKYFLELLINKYSLINFYRPDEKKDSVDSIINIYKNIRRIKDSYIDLFDKLPFTLTTMERIFELTKFKGSYIKFIKNVNNDLAQERRSTMNPKTNDEYEQETDGREQIILELLQSEHIKEYITHYDKYRPFIKTNSTNPNLVSALDAMISSGTYNAQAEKNTRREKYLRNSYMFPESEHFNFQKFKDNYSGAGDEFINQILYFTDTSDEFFKKHDKTFFELFKTTNKNNYKIRYKVLCNFMKSSKDQDEDSLEKLSFVLSKIDSDKNTKKFIQRILKDDLQISLNNLVKILESNPSKKLNIFYNNIKEICLKLWEDDKASCINEELQTPFCLTRHYKADKDKIDNRGYSSNIFSNVASTIIGNIKWLGVQAVNFLTGTGKVAEPKYKSESIIIDNPVNTINMPEVEETLPAAESVETLTQQVDTPKENQISLEELKQSAQIVMQNMFNNHRFKVDIIPPKMPSLFRMPDISRMLPAHAENSTLENNTTAKRKRRSIFSFERKAPSPAKIETANKIIEFVKTKLGPKMFLEQSHDYTVDATKMRLQMLPEIFDSIAETRKRDRAFGIRRPITSNKDALILYSKINGANRRLINYMLKKRNADGTRIFDVKEIIAFIENAENEIISAKKLNPNYRAKDKKEYYSQLLREKVQEYGKVKPIRKKKTNNIKKA